MVLAHWYSDGVKAGELLLPHGFGPSSVAGTVGRSEKDIRRRV